MVEVELLKAFRVPGGLLRQAGAVVEVDASLVDGLVERGIAFPVDAKPAPVKEAVPEPEPEPDPVPQEPKPEPKKPAGKKRPARSANATEIRDYLESRGVDTKGLSRKQMLLLPEMQD